jgi:hypothetical protein
MAHHDSGDEVEGARRNLSSAALGAVLVLGTLVLGVALSGSVGSFLTFLLALTVFVAPGFFLVRPWFSGPERWLTGAAVGFLLNAFVAGGLYQWGHSGLGASALASGVLTGALVLGLRGPAARGTPSDNGKWLAASMILVLVLVAVPFLRVGERFPEGVAYRAYFSADLMTHLSVVGELQKESVPPENPFYSGEPLGYYWLFFVFPALVGERIGNQQALLLTYLAGGLVFAGLAYAAGRRLVSRPSHAFVAVLAGLVAASFEGIALLLRSLSADNGFRDMNVDGFSRWVFELVSLDGLHRSLLYTPQHLFSYTLLVILILLVLRGGPRGFGSSCFAGFLLGGMAGTSIVTAMLAGPWLVGVRLTRRGELSSMILDLAGIALVSLASLGWYFSLGFFGEAGAALVLRRPQLLEIPALMVLECGALFVLALPACRERRSWPFVALAVVSFVAVLSLDIRGYEGVWMAWRAGSVLLLSLMLLAAAGLRVWSRTALLWILLPASLTALLDVYNAQDTSNRAMSAGEFRWTTLVSDGEMDALLWIRNETERTSIVQWDSRAREPGEWAVIPALAERRMAVGFPIFLLERGKYRRRERRSVRTIFISEDPDEAHRFAVDAGIDYLFVGRREIEVRGELLRKFWEAPALFERVFSNREVSVFRVVH